MEDYLRPNLISTTREPIVTHDRTAGPAIRGYKYQFDRTIIELIEADRDALLTIEGIEDYDRISHDVCESVQVKYLEAQSFSLALIRDAIAPMLANSTANQDRQYRLYIHCGDLSNFTPKLNLDALKTCLTKRPQGKPPVKLFQPYTDDQLSNFCARLKLEAGKSYEGQKQQAINALIKEFNCSAQDCYDLFFPASRDVVSEIAIRTSLADRIISKRDFINKIDRRHQMYTRWHAKHIGEARFVAALRRRVRAACATDPTKYRLVTVSHGDFATEDLVSIAARLSNNYRQRSLVTARPWTIVIHATDSEIISFKRELLHAGLSINDGWEHISFRPEQFDAPPIVNTRGRSKIIDLASYALRVVSHRTYITHQEKILRPNHVFSTGNQTIPGFEGRSFHLADLPVERIYEVMGVQ